VHNSVGGIMAPKGVIEGWRELHNEVLHNLYSSLNTLMTKSKSVRSLGM